MQQFLEYGVLDRNIRDMEKIREIHLQRHCCPHMHTQCTSTLIMLINMINDISTDYRNEFNERHDIDKCQKLRVTVFVLISL